MVPVTSMLAAMSGKPFHSEPVWRKRKARSTSTALRVLSVERLGRMRTSLKSSLTSVSMRMELSSVWRENGRRRPITASDPDRRPQRARFGAARRRRRVEQDDGVRGHAFERQSRAGHRSRAGVRVRHRRSVRPRGRAGGVPGPHEAMSPRRPPSGSAAVRSRFAPTFRIATTSSGRRARRSPRSDGSTSSSTTPARRTGTSR